MAKRLIAPIEHAVYRLRAPLSSRATPDTRPTSRPGLKAAGIDRPRYEIRGSALPRSVAHHVSIHDDVTALFIEVASLASERALSAWNELSQRYECANPSASKPPCIDPLCGLRFLFEPFTYRGGIHLLVPPLPAVHVGGSETIQCLLCGTLHLDVCGCVMVI